MIDKKDLDKVKTLIELLNKASFDNLKITEVVLLSRSIGWLGQEYMKAVKEPSSIACPIWNKIIENLDKAKKKTESNAAERKKKKTKKVKKWQE